MTQPNNHPPGKDRRFIADEGFCLAVHGGKTGFKVKVRLTSYRSLPLSCIEAITLKIDGEAVAPADIHFILNGHSLKLAELGKLSKVWWFILDYAELFVARPQPLAAGEHEVEGSLTTCEPYITAGRFTFVNSAKKRLVLEPENLEVAA